MTVNELIKDLKKYDGNLRVISDGGIVVETDDVLVEILPPELEHCVELFGQAIK